MKLRLGFTGKDGERTQIPTSKYWAEQQIGLVESRVGVGEDGDTAICAELNQPYVTLCWGHSGNYIKKEGSGAVMFETPELAWDVWFAAFEHYCELRNHGELHWRKRPELCENNDGRYAVVARLCIGKVRKEGDGKA